LGIVLSVVLWSRQAQRTVFILDMHEAVAQFLLVFACMVLINGALTYCHLPSGLGWLVGKATSPLITAEDSSAKRAMEEHADEEYAQMLTRSWKISCSYLVHLHALFTVVTIHEFLNAMDLHSAMFLLWIVLAYVDLIITVRTEMTPARARLLCVLLYCCLLACVLACGLDTDEERFLLMTDSLKVSQMMIAIVYPDRNVVAGFGVCFAVAYTVITASVVGVPALNTWFLIQQSYQMVLCLLLAGLNEKINRDRIEASFRSQDSCSLVLAFRRMLKGVSDGELVLDSGFKIKGDCSCLQRLLETSQDFAGRALADLLVDNENAVTTLDAFLTQSRGSGDMPHCLRVALKWDQCEISVDLFHVALPQLTGTTHLLAIKQDADVVSKMHEEALPSSMPRSLLGKFGNAGAPSVSSTSNSRSEGTESFEELSQMTLLLDASTDMIDVKEAYLRFTRQQDKDKFGMGMPSLQKFVRPLDWHGVSRTVRNFSSRCKKEVPEPQEVPPLMLRIPGGSRQYIHAHSGFISSFFPGPRPKGKAALLHLTLQDFGETLRTKPQSGICKLPSHAPSSVSHRGSIDSKLPNFKSRNDAKGFGR